MFHSYLLEKKAAKAPAAAKPKDDKPKAAESKAKPEKTAPVKSKDSKEKALKVSFTLISDNFFFFGQLQHFRNTIRTSF